MKHTFDVYGFVARTEKVEYKYTKFRKFINWLFRIKPVELFHCKLEIESEIGLCLNDIIRTESNHNFIVYKASGRYYNCSLITPITQEGIDALVVGNEIALVAHCQPEQI